MDFTCGFHLWIPHIITLFISFGMVHYFNVVQIMNFFLKKKNISSKNQFVYQLITDKNFIKQCQKCDRK